MSDNLAAALAVPGAQADQRLWTTGQVVSIDAGASRIVVTLDGGGHVRLPHLTGTYAVNDTVAVLRDAQAGHLILGKLGAAPAPPSGIDGGAGGTGAASFTALIRPTWSGTYRTGSGWDRLNVTRYGGRSDLYQGNAYGSGVLTGLAVYGDQIVGLGASTITSITARVVLSNNAGTPQLQGSPSGTQPAGAPSVSGATASGFGDVALPSTVCESMRTGALKGLVTNGATYVAIRGTSLADGMTLTVTYTKPV